MKDTKLGRLRRIDLRDIWASEPGDFTPWLANAENLELLSDTIGIDLELEAIEKNVGPFRADILCKDTASGSWVLVENQLESTDHRHLGQLLTYAAGLEAVTIVWLAATFTEEHRATLDWLNQITDDRFSFFGLEIELWQIGESLAAPKFNVVSKPNEWSKSVLGATQRISPDDLTDTKQKQLDYWLAFKGLLEKRKGPIQPGRSPRPQHWMHFSIGRAGFLLGATVDTRKERCGVEIFINDDLAKGYFRLLEKDREQIEIEFGCHLDWQELSQKMVVG